VHLLNIHDQFPEDGGGNIKVSWCSYKYPFPGSKRSQNGGYYDPNNPGFGGGYGGEDEDGDRSEYFARKARERRERRERKDPVHKAWGGGYGSKSKSKW
jgi:hypothetical protein